MENIDEKIQRLIKYYERNLGTRNPMIIAQNLGIRVAIVPLGKIAGNYQLLKRKRWIFVNEEIPRDCPFFQVIVAHELGHAVLHQKENCAFIKNKTLLLTSGIEREANRFAAYLLITDDMLEEFFESTEEKFYSSTGYPQELLALRLE